MKTDLWRILTELVVDFPDSIVDSGDTRRSFQRGLAPHMDCCPKDICSGSNKKEFREIAPNTVFVIINIDNGKNEGGFECVLGFTMNLPSTMRIDWVRNKLMI